MARSGDWDGSNVHDDHLSFLRQMRRLPSEGYVQGEFFCTKLDTAVKGEAAQCGAFVVVRCPSSGNCFPFISLTQSVKLWQKSYFYVKNVHPTSDFVNLPACTAGPPTEPRTNWTFKPGTLFAASTAAIARLKEMTESEGLKGMDLLTAFVERRVPPLQGRPYLISRMSGHQDPCRMSTKEMPATEVARLVNYISNCKISEGEWQFGKWPYSRADSPPSVSS
ncbi:hypothetical protein VPH35_065756 [Triticum aestivum]